MSKSLQGAYDSQLGTKSLFLFDSSRLHYNEGSLKSFVANLKANITGIPPDNQVPAEVNADIGNIVNLSSSTITANIINVLQELLVGSLLINTENITTTNADLENFTNFQTNENN